MSKWLSLLVEPFEQERDPAGPGHHPLGLTSRLLLSWGGWGWKLGEGSV